METPNQFLFSEDYRKVFIHNFVGSTVIGVYPHERTTPQKVRINLEVWIKNVPTYEKLANTVDYSKLLETVNDALKDGSLLQEELAEKIAQKSLLIDKVLVVRVRTEKLEILPDGATAGVEICRTKHP